MKTIKGIPTIFNPNRLSKVSDLIYFDGPFLSHFISEKGDNYLYYWVDADEEYNRWLLIRTDIFTIQNYLERKISLFDVISNPNDGYLFQVDIDSDINYHNLLLVNPTDLPEDYLPSKDAFYDFEPSDNVDLASISQKYNSGILELHIAGVNVKYGSMPFHTFTSLLPKVEDIRKEMASKYTKAIKESESYNALSRDKQKNIKDELLLNTQYEYMYSMAGSVRVILKPVSNQISFGETYADSFADEFIGILKSGYNKECIVKFSDTYGEDAIKKYSELIAYLEEEKLSLGAKWFNVNSNIYYQENINAKDTSSILSNLSDFEFNDVEKIEEIGKFYSLNVKSGAYSFEASEEDFKSTGFLDANRKEMAYSIFFNKKYKVTIERKSAKQLGGKEKIKDVITSFYPVE